VSHDKTPTDAAIAIKPHHFVDILAALGTGQACPEPHPYGHALHTVMRRIVDDPSVMLRIELGADDICRPCRHNVGGLCDDTIDTSFRPAAPPAKGEYNLLLDRRWCERLGLAEGEELPALTLCERIGKRMDNLAGIYREDPSAKTAKKHADLARGVALYLARARA